MFNNTTQPSNSTLHLHNIPLAIHISLATVITLPNGVVILVYISLRKKRDKIPNYLMFAQAIVDLYQGAFTWYEALLDVVNKTSTCAYALNIMHVAYAGLSMIYQLLVGTCSTRQVTDSYLVFMVILISTLIPSSRRK